jgi:hypothetical protein
MSWTMRMLACLSLVVSLGMMAGAFSFQAGAQGGAPGGGDAPGVPGSASGAPLEVTSDTPEYCLRLLDRVVDMVHASAAPPPEATRLSSEGERMCDQGQTRGGIQRLRRAWVLLTHPDGTPAR